MNEDLRRNATTEELAQAGVHIPVHCQPNSRGYDLLSRYRAVPNHAMFLYTSEDFIFDAYIRNHWAALDGMSGKSCDIYVSLMQLVGEEDAYSQFDDIRSLPGMDSLDASSLPALHIWSSEASVRLLLAPFSSEASLRDILRLVFSKLNNSPLSPEQADELVQAVRTFSSEEGIQQEIRNAHAGRDIIQITHVYQGSNNQMGGSMPSKGKSKQTIESAHLIGAVKQTSDTEDATQRVKDVTGSELKQSVRSEKQWLMLGKYSATGKWAVIGLVIVVIIFLFFKWLPR